MLTEMNKSGYKGFTLIELVLAMTILSILVAIVIPTISSYLYKARRIDGKVLLLEIANAQQNFYATPPNSYASALTDLGYVNNQLSESGYYNVALTATPKGCAPGTATLCTDYVLTAAPQKGQVGDKCGSLTLDNFGVKDVTGSLPVAACW